LDGSKDEWKTFKLFDKGSQETLEIEFENGEIVVCTPDHKWYVTGADGTPQVVKASELLNYDHILT
jgi:intein/homing endonuclease